MLALEDLHLGYGPVDVIKGISLEVAAGEVVCILGGNGSGKSTILKAIAGFLEPQAGVVRFDGEVVNDVPAHRRWHDGLVYIPQDRKLFGRKTVYENIELGCLSRGEPRAVVRRRVEEMLEHFPVLREKSRLKALTLSGGEQQTLSLARALMGITAAHPPRRALRRARPGMDRTALRGHAAGDRGARPHRGHRRAEHPRRTRFRRAGLRHPERGDRARGVVGHLAGGARSSYAPISVDSGRAGSPSPSTGGAHRGGEVTVERFLEGRTALVTGASRGIGRATALALAVRGAAVCVHCRERRGDAEAVARAVEEPGADGASWSPPTSPIRTPSAKRSGPSRARSDASTYSSTTQDSVAPNRLPGADLAVAHRIIDVNLKGPLNCIVAALPLLRASGGIVVNIGALNSRGVSAGGPAYRRGQGRPRRHDPQPRARDLGPLGVRINAVAPPLTETDMGRWAKAAGGLAAGRARGAASGPRTPGRWPRSSPSSARREMAYVSAARRSTWTEASRRRSRP